MSWLSLAISVIPRAVGNFDVMLAICLLTCALNARLALSRCAFGILFVLELNSLILRAFALRSCAIFCFLLAVYCLRACVTPVCLRLAPAFFFATGFLLAAGAMMMGGPRCPLVIGCSGCLALLLLRRC